MKFFNFIIVRVNEHIRIKIIENNRLPVINLKLQRLILEVRKFMKVSCIRRSVCYVKQKIRHKLETNFSNKKFRPSRATNLRACKKRCPEAATIIKGHPTAMPARSVSPKQ